MRRGFTSYSEGCSGATISEDKASGRQFVLARITLKTHLFLSLRTLLFCFSLPTLDFLTPSDLLHLQPSHAFKLSALSYISPTCFTSSSRSSRININLCAVRNSQHITSLCYQDPSSLSQRSAIAPRPERYVVLLLILTVKTANMTAHFSLTISTDLLNIQHATYLRSTGHSRA